MMMAIITTLGMVQVGIMAFTTPTTHLTMLGDAAIGAGAATIEGAAAGIVAVGIMVVDTAAVGDITAAADTINIEGI